LDSRPFCNLPPGPFHPAGSSIIAVAFALLEVAALVHHVGTVGQLAFAAVDLGNRGAFGRGDDQRTFGRIGSRKTFRGQAPVISSRRRRIWPSNWRCSRSQARSFSPLCGVPHYGRRARTNPNPCEALWMRDSLNSRGCLLHLLAGQGQARTAPVRVLVEDDPGHAKARLFSQTREGNKHLLRYGGFYARQEDCDCCRKLFGRSVERKAGAAIMVRPT